MDILHGIDFLFKLSTPFRRRKLLRGCPKNMCSLGNISVKNLVKDEEQFLVNLQVEGLRMN